MFRLQGAVKLIEVIRVLRHGALDFSVQSAEKCASMGGSTLPNTTNLTLPGCKVDFMQKIRKIFFILPVIFVIISFIDNVK